MPRPKTNVPPKPEIALLIAAERKRAREEYGLKSLSAKLYLQGYRTADPYR